MQPTALSIILTAAFTLTVKPFPHGSFWITAPSFFFFLNKRKSILDSDVLLVNNNCKTQLKRDFFSFFSILCISCMLMFCACFCKDWMRYCNIPAIAPDICTSQLSINMLKEELKLQAVLLWPRPLSSLQLYFNYFKSIFPPVTVPYSLQTKLYYEQHKTHKKCIVCNFLSMSKNTLIWPKLIEMIVLS